MERWNMEKRHEVAMVDLEALVPKDHLLRKIEQVMDYEWIYTRLEPYYCADNGRPNTDPVILIKMVLLQHLFGIPSLRQTHARIQDTLSYRWFLGLGFYDDVPHFATVSYAFRSEKLGFFDRLEYPWLPCNQGYFFPFLIPYGLCTHAKSVPPYR